MIGWRKRASAKGGMTVLLTGAALLLAFPTEARDRQEEPGIYNMKGWNGVDMWFDPNASAGTANSIDVDGQVGYPLYVSGPTARCTPGPGWNAQAYIETGSFPPGVNMNYQGSVDAIGGIPLERGHWIMRMKMADIQCNGVYYKGFTQEIRFHITGSGQVVQ